jgi:hypothetical protein
MWLNWWPLMAKHATTVKNNTFLGALKKKRTANIGFVKNVRIERRSHWTDFNEIWY